MTSALAPLRRLRAGIIPYSRNENGKIVFLFGKEIFGKWSPFAGRVEPGEDLKIAAAREFVEEIMGFFSEIEIVNRIVDKNKLVIGTKTSISHLYLIPVSYDPNLPNYFINITNFFLRCTGGKKNEWGIPILDGCQDGYFEKSEIDWFTLEEIRRMSMEQRKEYFGTSCNKVLNALITRRW